VHRLSALAASVAQLSEQDGLVAQPTRLPHRVMLAKAHSSERHVQSISGNHVSASSTAVSLSPTRFSESGIQTHGSQHADASWLRAARRILHLMVQKKLVSRLSGNLASYVGPPTSRDRFMPECLQQKVCG